MLEVDKNTFEAEVLQAPGKVLVDFYGDGCVPCAALMPYVHGYAETYGDKLKFCALNTTKAVSWIERCIPKRRSISANRLF